ncbi:SWF/SNF family helicase [Geomonas sp. Red276]
MPPVPAPDKKLLEAFARCTPLQRSVVQLLSIVYAPVPKTTLLNILRHPILRTQGEKALNGVTLSELLDHLKRLKLVRSSHDGFRCDPSLMHHATLSAQADQTFEPMATTAQREIPMVSEWGGYYYRTPLQAVRDIRIAIHRKDVDAAIQALERFQRQYPYEASVTPVFETICNSPFDGAWFRTLPLPIQAASLKGILCQAQSSLKPSREQFQILHELVEQNALPEAYRDLYCMELFLRGRLADAIEACQPLATSLQAAVAGALALARGGRQESIELFEAAITLLKKETGKRKVFFDDLTGPIYLVALLGSGDEALLKRCADYCSFVTKRKEWPYQTVYLVLEEVIKELRGERGGKKALENSIYQAAYSPQVALFMSLALHWCDSNEAKVAAEHLPKLSSQAQVAGYQWLADEFTLAASACGVESEPAAQARQRYLDCQLVPLCDAVEKIEFWENALAALMKLTAAEKSAPDTAAGTMRLIWHCDNEGRHLEVTPREQKQGASGKWSSGKNVSLKRLAEEPERLGYLTDQDLKVCSCIKKQREFGGYYGYGREVYRLDLDQALPLLVAHPHTYLDAAGTVRLELVRGEPELQFTAEGKRYQLSIFPPFEPDQKIYIQKESPTRLKIFEAREEHHKIAAVLGKGLTLPAKAQHKALEAINSLSSLLTVHSDIGDAAAQQVEGDPTPCFHLLPYSAGIKLELLVRPFSQAGPYFRPGGGGETILAEIEGNRLQAKRDLRLEVRRAADAVAALTELPESEESDNEWLVPSPDRALEVVFQLQSLGDSVRVAWPEGAKFRVKMEASPGHCKASIRQAKDYFELEGELKLDEGLTLNLRQLVDMARDAHGRFVPLGDGEFLALSAQLRKRLEEIAAFADLQGNAFRFHPLSASLFEEFADEVGDLSTDRKWKEHLRRLREARSFTPQLPPTLQAELRGYQEEGFAWLNRLSHWGVGACLADDMGLGKTVQALAQILTMAANGPSLVVAPTSVCLNWESETRKFAPTLNVVMFGGGKRAESLKGLKPFDLVVCSYGLLQQDGELLAAVPWQAIVLDEAQAIKNMATKRSQAAMELKGEFKMVATGTPIENHLGELWNVFRFINPGLLGSLKQFNVKFASPIEKSEDKKARQRLKKLIQPFILRRTKNQVLEELPSRTEITVRVEMGKEEAALYEAMRRSALDNLAGIGKVEGKGELHMKILAEIMRLRRACCNPRLVLPETPIPSAKLAAFGEILEELRENRHKALVFSQFVGHLAIIREFVERCGISYQYLDGSTPPAERKRSMDAFQAGEGDLFLISLKAGGVGLNLTAADYVIHMDPWWNPAVEDQASDRAHRIGQQRPVTIYRLVAKGTIEEKIVGLHQQKRGLADSLLEESDISGKMTADELLALLRSDGR